MAYAEVDAGYEAAKGGGSCPDEGTYTPPHYDPWGFVRCNCTSYVAYRLRLNNVRIDPNNQNSELFDNTWGPNSFYFGYARDWNDGAVTAGIRIDQYPAIGAVAHWEKVGRGTGHVSYVQRLYTNENDGRLVSFDLVEYNWPADLKYHSRNVSVGESGQPERFLHFEAMGRDANIPGSDTATNVTCVTGLSVKPSGAHDGAFCWKHSGSDADCGDASAYYYFDYQTCQKYTVSSSYCSSVGSNRGYIAHIGNGFPEPIDPAHRGNGFAACDAFGTVGYGGASEKKHSKIRRLF
jgi:surface antigen